jgi:hypothetical protein
MLTSGGEIKIDFACVILSNPYFPLPEPIPDSPTPPNGMLRGTPSRETPEQIIKGILDQVSMFANGQPQQDDMTLVVMGVQGGCDD